MTRQPALRSEAAEPLPTSPKPATIATLPAIITSVPRRMPSTSDFAAAIEVVELRLGDAVVDVDGREQQLASFCHLVEAVDARGGLFGDALDGLGAAWLYQPGLSFRRFLMRGEEDFLLLVVGLVEEGRVALLGAQPRWISSVASPPSSRIMFGVPPSAHSKMRVRVVPVLLEASRP